jgi:hypothetical protein
MNSDTISVELRELILTTANRVDVHSVSCQFRDVELWHGLLSEQVKRARSLDKAPPDAYCLCGPDGGIPRVAKFHPGLEGVPDDERFDGSTLEEKLRGYIHIPFEGVCGADLFIYPTWRRLNREAWSRDDAKLYSATFGKPCNHLLLFEDVGDLPFATRIGPIDGWWLYSSIGPYRNCNPFLDSQ